MITRKLKREIKKDIQRIDEIRSNNLNGKCLYEELVANGTGWVTNVDGTRKEVIFDPEKLYCIYEEEGPENSEEPEGPSEE